MGLGVGTLMILYLLGLLTIKGLGAFWPRALQHIELDNGKTYLAQMLAIENRECDESGEKDSLRRRERYVYVGNRDAFGYSYKYIDENRIRKTNFPDRAIKIERREYGSLIGELEALTWKGETRFFPDIEGISFLSEAVKISMRRWEKIEKLEKTDLHRLTLQIEKKSRKMSKIERKTSKKKSMNPDEERDQLRREIDALTARAETLSQEIVELRHLQLENTLAVRLANGETTRIPVSQVMDFHFPNRLSLGGQVVRFLKGLWLFIVDSPRAANTEGGIFPALFGTLVMTLLMSVAVMPLGVMAAVYLHEYASQGPVVKIVRIAVNNLAGVPSIVFGVFGLGLFIYIAGGSIDRLFFSDRLPTPTLGTGGILWASLTLALLTVPVVIIATEESLASVPRVVREGALACGASQWQTIYSVVLPAAMPGILTGFILAIARGAGEVAPLMLVGVVKLAPALPVDGIFPFLHLDRKFMHLGFHIYDLGFQSPDSEASKPMVFATALLLVALVVTFNLIAIIVRNHLRKKYRTATF